MLYEVKHFLEVKLQIRSATELYLQLIRHVIGKYIPKTN